MRLEALGLGRADDPFHFGSRGLHLHHDEHEIPSDAASAREAL
jgi:hypothetical protein